MSIESLQAAAHKAAEDPAFAGQIRACTSAEEVIAVAQAAGLALSLEDIAPLARHAQSEALSDEQLDEVSGGVSWAAVGAIGLGILGGLLGMVAGLGTVGFVDALGKASGSDKTQ